MREEKIAVGRLLTTDGHVRSIRARWGRSRSTDKRPLSEWKRDYFATLGPSPTPQTKFKILALVSGPVNKSTLSPEELADDLQHQIEKVMDLGYDVVASDIWSWDLPRLESSLSTVANKEKSEAIYRMLHSKFTGTPAFSDPVAGQFFNIRRANQAK